jgi:hypothetical protein
MAILPKAIYIFNPHQNSNGILHRGIKINLNVHMEVQKTSNSKTILTKKRNTGGTTTSDFKTSYRVIVTKTAWYFHKNRHVPQWKRKKIIEKSPHSYSQYNFFQRYQKHMLEKREPFNSAGETVYHTATRSLSLILY